MNNFKDIVIVLTQKELKVRYKNNVLGYFWSIGSPLLHAMVFWVVFGLIMKTKVENYAIFLVSALFPWQWIANSVGIAPQTFVGNSSLIKKVNFPRSLISFVVTIQDLIHFVLSIPVILLFLVYYNIYPSWMWLIGIPLLCVIQLGITYSLNLLIATINLFFRDMEKIVQVLMMFLFYFTPVLYSVDQIPEEYRDFIWIHPIAPLMIAWRELFMKGILNWAYIGQSITVSIVFIIISHLVYKKLQWRFAEVL